MSEHSRHRTEGVLTAGHLLVNKNGEHIKELLDKSVGTYVVITIDRYNWHIGHDGYAVPHRAALDGRDE